MKNFVSNERRHSVRLNYDYSFRLQSKNYERSTLNNKRLNGRNNTQISTSNFWKRFT